MAGLVTIKPPRLRQVYEPGGLLTDIRARVQEFMGKHNEEFPAKKVYHHITPLKVQAFSFTP